MFWFVFEYRWKGLFATRAFEDSYDEPLVSDIEVVKWVSACLLKNRHGSSTKWKGAGVVILSDPHKRGSDQAHSVTSGLPSKLISEDSVPPIVFQNFWVLLVHISRHAMWALVSKTMKLLKHWLILLLLVPFVLP